ncbi:crustacean CHH/MIH/GIH neurohormone family domain-containing protein [Ditylenchus destructor]|nr:crustacean CHH/MIH/GIH neurohormone family domain-containing protein [Ditylenchus destructor]
MMLWTLLFVTCAVAQHKIDLNHFDKNGLLLKHINQTPVVNGDRVNEDGVVYRAGPPTGPWPPQLQTNCIVANEQEQLWIIMHRICEICHGMFDTTDPELRARCVSKCFHTPDFTKCLNLFKQKKP